MEWLSSFVAALQVVVKTPVGAVLLTLGIPMILIAALSASKAINSDPNKTGSWQKFLMMSTFVVGVLLVFSGPALSLFEELRKERKQKFVPETISRSDVFDRLEINSRVTKVIRLILRSPSDTNFLMTSIDKLPQIGPEGQIYTFVADYEEIRGFSAATAAKMMGLKYRTGMKVSAIIFPLEGRDIIPVNAMGALQAVYDIESQKNIDKRFDVKSRLKMDSFNALMDRNSPLQWSWQAYKDRFGEYCKEAIKLRCEKSWPVTKFVGEFSDDWHPLGFARETPVVSSDCSAAATAKTCGISDFSSAKRNLLPTFGTRAFLIENFHISDLAGRVLIDFSDPENQKIPYLY